jgi:hypothetical protein
MVCAIANLVEAALAMPSTADILKISRRLRSPIEQVAIAATPQKTIDSLYARGHPRIVGGGLLRGAASYDKLAATICLHSACIE